MYEFFFDDEEVIQSYQFIRDQIILTNYGIYEVDVQGLSGKKVKQIFQKTQSKPFLLKLQEP